MPSSTAITIVSGSTTITVFDNGPGDLDPTLNSISIDTGVGIPNVPGFTIVADSVFTNTPGSANGAILQTNYAVVATNSGGGTVSITSSATGFNQPPSSENPLTLDSELNGNGTFAGTITGQTWADTTNTLFGMGPNTPGIQGPLNTNNAGGYASDKTVTFSRGTDPYALTTQMDISLVPQAHTTGSFQVTVPPSSMNSPTITTVPNQSSVSLASKSVNLQDTADLEGGNNPTGSITFTLYQGSTAVDTETVPVNGNGTYTTPSGYTLPTTAAMTGTYQWDASYSGDSNNTPATDNGNTDEQVLVSPASPAITTTPNMTNVTLGTSSVTLTDTANLSGGYNETGTITFTLYLNGGSTPVDTETVTVNGNGDYTTPTGYTLPTSGGVVGTYQWDATYNGDTNNSEVSDNNATNEQVTVSPAGPAINTVAGGTVVIGSGTNLNDTAALSGGYNPTGTITFTLYSPENVAVYTDTVTVNGNGSYDTSTGTNPGGFLPTETGTYLWTASYSGDSNNNGATDNGKNENEAVSPASPAINTVAGGTVVIGSGSKLSDTANLSGGYNLTGTITFTLFSPENVAVHTDTVTVNGNGSYDTSTGTNPGGFLPTETGTYLWTASYSGDSNNSSAKDNGKNENEAVSPAGPAINTVAGGTVVIGSGSKLSDTANLSGGYNPTGTITFTLYSPSNVEVYTDTVTVSGNGSYDTSTGTNPGGYLPTATGTYLWTATYSGDSNNSSAKDNGKNENEAVSSASPSITTTPGGSVTIGSITICGTKFSDLTGNGFSSDDLPQSSVTINLYQESNGSSGLQTGNGGDTLVSSAKTNSSGVFSFTNLAPGTYYVQEAVPGGYLQTGGGPNGTTGNTYYKIVATGGYTYSGYNFDDFQIPTCQLCNVTYTVTTPSGSSHTYTTLTGNTAQGDTVTVHFTTTMPNQTVTLVSYNAPGASFSDSTANQQSIYQVSTKTFATAGCYSLTVKIPNNYYQIDFVCGSAISQLEPNQSGGVYGPDAANILYHAEQRFDSSDNGGTTAPNSSLLNSTPPNPATPTSKSGSTTPLSDSAKLSGGVNPTGTITFYLFAPGVTPNGTNSNNVYSDTVTVSGNGTYTTSQGNNAGGFVPTTAGTYQWVAVYSGDGNNICVTSPYGSEPEVATMPGTPVGPGAAATIGYWHNKNGQCLIDNFNGCTTSTALGNWLASNFPNLFGSFKGQTNLQVAADFLTAFGNVGGVQGNTYAQTFAVALAVYATDPTLGGGSASSAQGFTVKSGGTGSDVVNIGSNGAAFGVVNGSTLTVNQVLQILNSNYNPKTQQFYGGDQTLTTDANNVTNGINQGGDINANLIAAGLEYTPSQIRAAYGINNLSLDGAGQTIAIVDAYDNPAIFQSLDAFDQQFGLTDFGQTLYDQYGAASSFLTVLNQNGQTGSLPSVDPNGAGTDNWEVEIALDVEWAHAIAPGAKIVLVEANSPSLPDLMSSVATAGAQPGVSVVSMSWGFNEGLGIQASDEAAYDNTFTTPGVTYVASTGDYGTADPEYPAFSPNVLAVGGSSLLLNPDGTYSTEVGWGGYSNDSAMLTGSGGGLSQFESEPYYQEGVQLTGSRSTPDVSFVADPNTGAWVADTYNLSNGSPWEVVGGTSLAAPAWGGLIAIINQGRANAGESTLNTATKTETQQALYSLGADDFNQINSGSNGGYQAGGGYNLVTGLGTPNASVLVPDIIAYHWTSYTMPNVNADEQAAIDGSKFIENVAYASESTSGANAAMSALLLPTPAGGPSDAIVQEQGITFANSFSQGAATSGNVDASHLNGASDVANTLTTNAITFVPTVSNVSVVPANWSYHDDGARLVTSAISSMQSASFTTNEATAARFESRGSSADYLGWLNDDASTASSMFANDGLLIDNGDSNLFDPSNWVSLANDGIVAAADGVNDLVSVLTDD